MSKKTDSNKNEMFISRVIVENFPSRVELYQKLDNFISENNYPRDFTTDNKDNIVHFIFKNPDTAFEFVKYLNMEKMRNPLYAKLKTNIAVDAKKDLMKKKHLNNLSNLNINVNSSINLSSPKVMQDKSQSQNTLKYNSQDKNADSSGDGYLSRKNRNINSLLNKNKSQPNAKENYENNYENYDYSTHMPRVN